MATGFEEFAYEDIPLPIEEGQTISQLYIVAAMVEAAEVKPAIGCWRSVRARATRQPC